MEDIAQIISKNAFLQAISIVVAVGTLLIFIWKNFPPAFVFLKDYIGRGRRQAFNRLNRPIVRLAHMEAGNNVLILISLFRFSFQASLVFVLVLLMGIFLIVLTLMLIRYNVPDDLSALARAAAAAFGVISGVPFSWALFRPVERLRTYIFWTRRLALRAHTRRMRRKLAL